MLIKVIKQWSRLQESWCRLHLRKYSRHYTLFPQNFFSRVTDSGKTMGGCKFGNILPIIVQKCYRGYSLSFVKQQFQARQTISIRNPISTSFPILLTPWKRSIKTDSTTQIFIAVKMSRRTQKSETHLAIEGLGLAFFITEWGHFFGSNVEKKFKIGEVLRRKWSLKTVCVWPLLIRILSLMIKTNLIYYTFAALLPLYFPAKNGDLITTGQYMNHRTIGSPQLRPVLKKSCSSPLALAEGIRKKRNPILTWNYRLSCKMRGFRSDWICLAIKWRCCKW